MVDVSLFLEFIQQYSFLYDKKRKDFKDKRKKENAWREIADTLNATVPEVQTHWRTLRERYSKELKGTVTYSGQSPSNDTMTWEWFSAMEFLKEHIKPRKTSSAILATKKHNTPMMSHSEPIPYDREDITEDISEMKSINSQNICNNSVPEFVMNDDDTPSSSTSKPIPVVNNSKRAKKVDLFESIDMQLVKALSMIKQKVPGNEDDAFCKALAFLS